MNYGTRPTRRLYYILVIGDHLPRHVHVRTEKGKLLGRVDVDTFEGLENWTPPKDLINIIKELKDQGRL